MNRPIHSFFVGCLNPCLQRTSVRVVSPQPDYSRSSCCSNILALHILGFKLDEHQYVVFPPDDSSDDKILEVLEDGFMVIYTIVYVCVVDVQNRGVYGVFFFILFLLAYESHSSKFQDPYELHCS